jgi:ribosomal-protein-alanine N-acetyltransferase
MQVDDLPHVHAIDEVSFSTPWPKNAFRFELLENPNGYCWVAELDTKLVGFVVCWLIVDEAHIATIAVHPKYRGQGISKALVTTGLREMIFKGALMATLEVRAGNNVAQSLYRHFGFEQVGLRRRYYKDTHEDALLMTVKTLDTDYLAWLNSGTEIPRYGITRC